MKPYWDERFLRLAEHIAAWSRDPSTGVGCCIVRPDKTIASLGFNGLPRRVADTPERLHDRALKLELTLHAELNAILSAKEPLHGYILYVWPYPPCSRCAAAIIQSGIQRVVTIPSEPERWKANFELAKSVLSEANVQVDYLDMF